MNAVATIPSHLIDYAYPLRQRLIKACTPVATTARPSEEELRVLRLSAKARAAISRLGSAWILHQAYEFRPRHSFRATTWREAPGVLDEITARARLAGRL